MSWGHLVGIAIGALAGGFGIFFAERSRQVRKLLAHVEYLRDSRDMYRKLFEEQREALRDLASMARGHSS